MDIIQAITGALSAAAAHEQLQMQKEEKSKEN
jgi:hypothetical protein